MDYGYSENTWTNRVSQIRKWLAFCDEEGRVSLPATEGDVLAYTGYLSLHGRVSARSAPQYVSAVSQYHIQHKYASPTLTDTVRSLLTAYGKRDDRSGPVDLIRTGCDATLMKQVLDYGLNCDDVDALCYCAMTIFSFFFQCRAITVAHLAPEHVVIGSGGVMATLMHTVRENLRAARPSFLTPTARHGPLEADPRICLLDGTHGDLVAQAFSISKPERRWAQQNLLQLSKRG